MMDVPRIKGWIGVVGLLFSGVLFGSSFTLVYTNRRLEALLDDSQDSAKKWFMTSFRTQLGLSKQQLSEVERIYERTRIKRSLAILRARPIQNEPKYEFVSGVQALLNKNQREKFSSILDARLRRANNEKLADIMIRLKLSLDERRRFDALIASQVNSSFEQSGSVDEVYLKLLRSCETQISELLGPERFARYNQMISQLFLRTAD